MKEFEFINQIKDKFNLQKIGDDCAVLPKNKTHDMLITSDLIVEDIDFRRNWMVPYFLGHKALTVSLSDIAAMGGTPLYSMLSIGIPEDVWKTDFVDEFYQGYLNLANNFSVELIGGDVSKTPDKIVIDSTVIGEVEKGEAKMRSSAQMGDLIYVTGQLGGASAGLKLLEKGVKFKDSKAWQKSLISKQLTPFPCLDVTSKLASLITSMIDISDGLSSDLGHICQASQVGAKIFADKIPLHKNLKNITKDFSEQLNFALNGGEDFEILFTINPKKKIQKNLDHFFCIGEITANIGNIELIDREKTTVLQPKGYQHF
ncbi:MAG: thiamine-phosphate kinase [Pyrinomonadaceae bacterium]|nr:thiamine-phosphate kinase [Pyrinomonadaceae bacterium]